MGRDDHLDVTRVPRNNAHPHHMMGSAPDRIMLQACGYCRNADPRLQTVFSWCVKHSSL
jgi:hypothetical protein